MARGAGSSVHSPYSIMRVTPLLLALVLVGCDSGGLEAGEPFSYATDGTDSAVDVVQAPNGDLVVTGSTEGVQRPADGTLALPTVLRFGLDGELTSAEVYRDLGFGSVQGVALVDGGLAIAVSAGPDDPGATEVTVYLTDDEGRRQNVVLRPDAGFTQRSNVRVLDDGSVAVAVYAATVTSPQLYLLRPDGTVVWSERLANVQDILALEAAPGGDLYVLGSGSQGSTITRVSGADGSEVWGAVRPSSWTASSLARTASGLAVLESNPAEATLRVSRLCEDGARLSTATVVQLDTEGESSRSLNGTAIEALSNDRVAVAWVESGPSFQTPPDAYVAVVGLEVESAARFGERGRWAAVNALQALTDGRVAAVGEAGPEFIGGFGGDDFDVRVTLYDVD
ncbi:hypothetical protein [Rubrivirga sp.]|uniref:hypothetical protein n=1 Tax=Rubrivirga sp. TaxID=1885344 RepID=UPI003C737D0F